MIFQYSISVLALALCTQAGPQRNDAYVQKTAGIPFKLSIRPASHTVRVGQNVELIVAIQDSQGQPVPLKQDFKARITVTEPSGRVVLLSERISAGRTSDTQSYTPRSTARHSVEAKDPSGQLLSDKYSFLLLAGNRAGAHKSCYVLPEEGWWAAAARGGVAAKPAPEPSPAPRVRTARAKPKLYLELLAREEGVMADGEDCATVVATYVGEDGQSPAPVDFQGLDAAQPWRLGPATDRSQGPERGQIVLDVEMAGQGGHDRICFGRSG